MQDGDLLRSAQPGQRCLQLQRFLDGLVDELLENFFSPRSERPSTEAAAESFCAGEADTVNLVGIAIEHRHAGIGHEFRDFVLLAGLIVMIAQHGDGRNTQ